MKHFDFSLHALGSLLQGVCSGSDVVFHRFCMDTRQLQPGDCFIAFKGQQVNGHHYIREAVEKGAVAVIGSEYMEPLIPTLRVNDIEQALLVLAKLRRAQITVPVIGVTGSCGKTTTKTLLASILKEVGAVHYAEKSFNNAIGLPLTLLQAQPHHDFIVLEIGTNYPGEIAMLTAIAQPSVSVITNAAPVHLEGLGSVQGVAKEKGAIISGTSEDGTVILNKDDAFYDYWQGLAHHRKIVSIGRENPASWQGEIIKHTDEHYPHCAITTPEGTFTVTLPLAGDHNVLNALSASAAAYEVGASLAAIKQGLASSNGVHQRMVVHQLSSGAKLIDDTYNANPQAMAVALQLLHQYDGHKIVVMGDMGELGQQAVHYHQMLGQQARLSGVSALYALGDLSLYTVQAFGAAGHHFDDVNALVMALKPYVQCNDTVLLVKGSRSMALERVVQPLLEEFK
ncbi:MAG: UDP-N-acetylmuramoyl-tripeptide--D-alanyl-D-alanine ligase [Gammaproteobacteria bacterium]